MAVSRVEREMRNSALGKIPKIISPPWERTRGGEKGTGLVTGRRIVMGFGGFLA